MQRFLRHLLPTGVLLLQVNAGTPIVWFGSWLCENSGGIARVEYLRRIARHENLNTTAQAVGHFRAPCVVATPHHHLPRSLSGSAGGKVDPVVRLG